MSYKPTKADFDAYRTTNENAGEYIPSKEDFEQYMEPENRTGLTGIARDIQEGIANSPEAFLEFIKQVPGQAYESAGQIATNPLRAAGNVGAGLLEGIKGGLNIPSNIAQYLNERDVGRGRLLDYIRQKHIGETGLQNAIFGEDQPGDELLRGLGSFSPYAKLGGMAKGLAGTAKRAGAAGLYGIAEEQNPITAALMGMFGEGALKGAEKGINIARNPESFLPSSPLNPEQLQRAMENTAGTETSLGNVIENPFLKKQFENKLPYLPFSGANQAMQRTAKTIEGRGNDILNDFNTSRHSAFSDKNQNTGASIKESLLKAEKETRNTKNEYFDALNEAAGNAGVITDRANLREKAKNLLEEIESDKDLSLLTDSSTKTLLKQLAEEGEKEGYSLKNTDLLRSKLAEKASDSFMKGDSGLGKKLAQLRDAALEDINSAIDNSGNSHLTQLREKAMKFYKNEWLPFEDKDITKFTRKGGDPDLLVNAFLKKSNITDRSNLLEKLLRKLPDNDRKAIALDYFSRAVDDGKLNPLKLRTLFDGLGERQKKTLLTPGEIKKLKDFSTLVQKNTDPLTVMFNSRSGERGLSNEASSVISSLGGIIGTASTGSIPSGMLSALLPALLGRPITKLLSNEKSREKIIKKLIKAKQNPYKPLNPSDMEAFVNALSQASQTSKPMELELEAGKIY